MLFGARLTAQFFTPIPPSFYPPMSILNSLSNLQFYTIKINALYLKRHKKNSNVLCCAVLCCPSTDGNKGKDDKTENMKNLQKR